MKVRATSSPVSAFEQWRAADPLHATAYAEVETLWENRAFEQALKDLAVDLELPPSPVTTKPPKTRFVAAAATLLLALGIGWMADVPMRLQADHMTDVAQLERFDLEDGSHIVLGSHSAIEHHLRRRPAAHQAIAWRALRRGRPTTLNAH